MYTGFKDYYELLKIPFSATETEIKNAYRQQAKEFHPDLHPDDIEHFTEKFREITEAYETLSDSLKKTNYDFLYRRVVLQEFPQEVYYQEPYYEDPTPPDERVYTHKYTASKKRGNVNVTAILVGVLLVLQLAGLIIKAAPVHDPADDYKAVDADFRSELQNMSRKDYLRKDSSILFINQQPGAIN